MITIKYRKGHHEIIAAMLVKAISDVNAVDNGTMSLLTQRRV
jgi:hypothetical protein